MKYYIFQGHLIEKDEQCINLLDRGLLFGEGLFETIRVYNGVPFLLENHINRLKNGCKQLTISVDFQEILQAIDKFIEANQLLEGSLRLSVTGGLNYFITGRKGVPYSPKLYLKGYSALVSKIKRNDTSPLVYLKSLSFSENMLAKREAALLGYDEALFLNTKHLLAEGSVTNIFIVKRGELSTPHLSCGLLPGITREAIISVSKENNIPINESNISLNDLLSADEAFLTNSLMEVMPLVKVNNHSISGGTLGNITSHISNLYKEKVKSYTSP